MNTVLLVIFSYGLGSIPTGYWAVKALKGIDLRKVGSGSTGATNVLRNAGKPAAAFVFVIDISKGWLPVTRLLGARALRHQDRCGGVTGRRRRLRTVHVALHARRPAVRPELPRLRDHRQPVRHRAAQGQYSAPAERHRTQDRSEERGRG